MNCPLCGAKTTYQGLNRLECEGYNCDNSGGAWTWPVVGNYYYSEYWKKSARVDHVDPVLDVIVLRDDEEYPYFCDQKLFREHWS